MFLVPSFLHKSPTSVKVLIYPMFFVVTIPLKIMLYIVFLLFPIFHFMVDCFLFCPLKYIVQKLKPYPFREHVCYFLLHIFIFVLQYVILLLYIIFAFRPYFLSITLFVFKLTVYTIFVGGPLFSTSQTSYQFWAISFAALVYILKYTMTFNSNYKQLLRNLLDIKKKIVEENKTGDSNCIPIKLFDDIASEFMPLKMQLFILFVKLFFTGIFLYVTFDSISKGGNAGFFTTQIPLIITVVLPALVDSIWSPSNIDDKCKASETHIKNMLIHELQMNVPHDEPEPQSNKTKNCFSKHVALICPIFYTVKYILKSILFCWKDGTDNNQLKILICPIEIKCCKNAKTDYDLIRSSSESSQFIQPVTPC